MPRIQPEPAPTWQDFGARFLALQPPPPRTAFEHSQDGLEACWTPTVWNESGDKWYWGGSDIKADFESLAELAAIKHGRSRLIDDGDDRSRLGGRFAVFYWLDLLKGWLERDGFSYAAKYLDCCQGTGRDSDGNKTSTDWVSIKRVCELSAKYCEKLAAQDQATAPARESFREAGLTRGADVQAPAQPETVTNVSASNGTDQCAPAEPAVRKSRGPRGPAADHAGDRRAAELSQEFEGRGKPWESNLGDFCDALDEAGVPISIVWKNDHTEECKTRSSVNCDRFHLKTWADAHAEKNPVHVLKAIKRKIERGRKPNLAATVIQK